MSEEHERMYTEDNHRLAVDNLRLNDELEGARRALAWMARQVKHYPDLLPDNLVLPVKVAMDTHPLPSPDDPSSLQLKIMGERLKRLEEVLALTHQMIEEVM